MIEQNNKFRPWQNKNKQKKKNKNIPVQPEIIRVRIPKRINITQEIILM